MTIVDKVIYFIIYTSMIVGIAHIIVFIYSFVKKVVICIVDKLFFILKNKILFLNKIISKNEYQQFDLEKTANLINKVKNDLSNKTNIKTILISEVVKNLEIQQSYYFGNSMDILISMTSSGSSVIQEFQDTNKTRAFLETNKEVNKNSIEMIELLVIDSVVELYSDDINSLFVQYVLNNSCSKIIILLNGIEIDEYNIFNTHCWFNIEAIDDDNYPIKIGCLSAI